MENIGAYVFETIVGILFTVMTFFAERPYFIAVGCGLMTLGILAATKIGEANKKIDAARKEYEK